MNKKKHALFRTCTAFLCAFIISSIPIIALADDSVEELENQTNQLQSQLDNLNNDLNNLSSQITDLVSKMDDTNASIEKAQLDLAAAHLNEKLQEEAMKSRIKYLYEFGNYSFLHVLLTAESMGDFLNRAEFIKNITSYDRRMFEELKDAKRVIAEKEQTLLAEQAELQKMSDTLVDNQSQLQSLIANTSNELDLSSEALEKARAAQNAKPQLPPEVVTPTPEQPSTPDEPDQPSQPPAPPEPEIPQETEDLVLFAAILECEAGTRDYDALLAVATVIMNRVESSRYPNTLQGVIYQKGQFSPTWNGSLNRVLAKGPASLCYSVAQDALAGARLDAVRHCYSFRASYTGHEGIIIGGNVFF